MKHLLLCLCWLLGISASAQTYTDVRNGLPRDSTSYKVSFVGVVQAPETKQSSLYSAAREWFSTYYKSGKTVLDMDDREAGKLIGSGYTTFTQKGSLGVGVMQLWTTTKVYVKDGRYRYEITNFVLNPAANPGLKTSLETNLDSKSMFMVDRNGRPKAILQQMVDVAKAEADAQIASLNKALIAPTAKTKEW